MDNPIRATRIRGRQRVERHAITLLELLLALALSGLILYAISVAIDLHLRTLDARRTNVEEARLARSVLNMIANDLRSTLRYEEVDLSSIERLAQSSMMGAADNLGANLGLPGGAIPQGPPPAGGGGGAGGPGGAPGDGGGGGAAPPSGAPGGAGGGQGGGGGGAGQGGGGGAMAPNTGMGASGFSLESGDMAAMEPSMYTMDLAGAAMLPPVVGLYGNQFELQIDVSRLPRVDEYQMMQMPGDFGLPQVPSDIKTISYFVQDGMTSNSQVTEEFAPTGPTSALNPVSTGLVRREVDRSIAQFALNNGLMDSLFRTGDLLAPEINAIQFQYFDGMQWLPFWDSQQMQGLPLAVEIVISIIPRNSEQGQSPLPFTNIMDAQLSGDAMIYRLVVGLPLGELPLEQMYGLQGDMQNLGF